MRFYFLLIPLFLITSTASATIIRVPQDYPTIQAGIDTAVTGDTVLVDTGTYVENINFNGKNIVVGSLFLITEDTHYISETVIDGDRNGSVVTFEEGEDSSSVLAGFTITNGSAYNGGGLWCYNSSPSMMNLRVIGNRAESGGGIFLWNSEPLLAGVTISENAAEFGGGMTLGFSRPTFSYENRSSVYLNEAYSDLGSDLYAYNSPTIEVIVDTFTVIEPSVQYAYPINNFSFDILHSVEEQHWYVSPDGHDGNSGESPSEPLRTLAFALFKARGDRQRHTVHIANGIYSNSATGEHFPIELEDNVSIYGESQDSVLFDAEGTARVMTFDGAVGVKIKNMTLTGGSAEMGGGILCGWSSPAMDSVAISGNAASESGGGLYCVSSRPTLTNVLVSENSARKGGGIHLVGSDPTLRNVTIRGNSFGDGAGIYCESSDPILRNVTIADNSASENGLYGDGGGIYLRFSSPTLDSVTISENSAYGGGGIWCGYNSSPVLNHVTFNGNRAINNDGGGIYCWNSSPKLSNVMFHSNRAEDMGGAIACYDNSVIEIKDAIIMENVGHGGGIYSENAQVILESATIRDNRSSGGGGIFCTYGSQLRLKDVEILFNLTSPNPIGHGGGINCQNSRVSLEDVLISRNETSGEGTYGGGVYSLASTLIMVRTTISRNKAKGGGGGVFYANSSSSIIVNSILWNDFPEEIQFSPSGGRDTVAIAYSDLKAGEEGILTNNNGISYWLEGNIDADPLFVDLQSGDFHLQQGSPAIDAGTAFFVWGGDTLVNLPDTAYEGNAPDMGAFESPYSVGVAQEHLVPLQFALRQNYPNPFNPATTIEYSVPQAGLVSVTVYDILGREVERILNQKMDAGHHKVEWNAGNVPSGIYFVRMEATGFSQTRKVTVLR